SGFRSTRSATRTSWNRPQAECSGACSRPISAAERSTFPIAEKVATFLQIRYCHGLRSPVRAHPPCVRSVRRDAEVRPVEAPLYLDTARLGLMSPRAREAM